MTINRATGANIFHYRGRNNGIKCDGKMWIETNVSDIEGELQGYASAIRFMLTAVPAANSALWGGRSATEFEFSCYINTDMTITFNYSYNAITSEPFHLSTDVTVKLNKIYNVFIQHNDTRITLILADEYMTILDVATADRPGGTVYSTVEFIAIGALRPYEDDVIDILNNAYVYDCQFSHAKEAGIQTTAARYKYVFQKNYGGAADGYIYELNGNDAEIHNEASDAWGANRVNINKYVTSLNTINNATDKNNVQTYVTWGLSIRDEYSSVITGDTIVVEYNDGTTYKDAYCFKVLKAFDRGDGNIDLILVDVFSDLENIFCDHFFKYRYYGSSAVDNLIDFNYFMWWNNHIPISYGTDTFQTTTYSDLQANFAQLSPTSTETWIGLEYIFDRCYYVLQLDLIFGVLTARNANTGTARYTNIYSEDSRYMCMRYRHALRLGGYDSDVAFNTFQNTNGLRIGKLLRYLLLILQRRYYINDILEMADIITPDENDAITDATCYKIGKSKYSDNRVFNYVTVTDEINSTIYEGYDDTNNIDIEETNKNTLPDNLIICERNTADADTTILDYTEILALHLDSVLYKEYSTIQKESDLERDFSQNYYKRRNDNIETLTQTIEEYTEG